MDPTSRFMAALALASASLIPMATGTRASAEELSEAEMYQRCKDGGRRSCEAFLNAYPQSRYAPEVLGLTVDKMSNNAAGGKSEGGKGPFSPDINIY